jgi:hypothetical protein
MQPKYAASIEQGDLVMVMAGDKIQLSVVLEAWQSSSFGAFNPFVHGADLVVNNVVGGCQLTALELFAFVVLAALDAPLLSHCRRLVVTH